MLRETWVISRLDGDNGVVVVYDCDSDDDHGHDNDHGG